MAEEFTDEPNLAHDCAHAICNCTVAADEMYCSAYCENAANAPDITCACGHPECESEMPVEESSVSPV